MCLNVLKNIFVPQRRHNNLKNSCGAAPEGITSRSSKKLSREDVVRLEILTFGLSKRTGCAEKQMSIFQA